jgi:hypothetical protein
MIWLLTPPLSPTSQSLARPAAQATHRKTENERQLLLTGGGGGGGEWMEGKGAKWQRSLTFYNTLNTL